MKLLLTVLAAASLLAFGSPPAGAQTPPALTTVRVGVLGNDDMISVLYAQKTGMYAKAGLDVQIDKSSPNGSAIAAAVVAGSYDIGKASAPALIDAHLKGLPFVIIGTAAVYERKNPYVALIVPKDSPIKSIADITSGIYAVSFIHDGAQLSMSKAIGRDNPALKNVQFVELPMSASAAAVDQGRVAGGEASYPPLQAAMDTGKFRLLPIYDALGDGYSFSVWFTTQDYIKKHADAVKTFQRVTAQSARYTNAHHAATAQMLSDFTGVPLATIQRMPRSHNGTGITPADLAPWINAEAQFGYIKNYFPPSELIDPTLANNP
jgi:ABC-type nitrate/sulfonate/bicarbonate transport system substrate-binding protein